MTRISRLLIFCVMMMVAAKLHAQGQLVIQGTPPQLYVVHTVAAKENWYSVGRIYNQSPKEIAPFNNASMDKPLAIGQQLKIPLTPANFSQDGNKASDEVFVALYHVVGDKEWMYRISQAHNKVPVANLEKWNNLTNDQLRQGMKLIVGYLKVKQGQSALATGGVQRVTTVAPPVAKNDPVREPIKNEPVKEPVKEVVSTPPPVAKPEPVKPEPVKTEPVKTDPVKTDPVKVEPVKQPEVKEEPKPVVNNPVEGVTGNAPASFRGGYFKSNYSESGKGTAGNAASFRSTSGWKDGKYYALINNVPVGTIVRLSFSSTNKSVYAKVLGQLPEMKENVGLTVRISDAAASELGTSAGKFYVDVKY